jgi:hypothetical protein
MPKAPGANDGKTPKKRIRKTAPVTGNGIHPEVEAVAQVAEPKATSPELTQKSQAAPVPEEKVRARAYELYLQRGGQGGSPEQDWLQALREISGQQRTA